MERIIVHDKYTKAQRRLIDSFTNMFGKTYNESSLTTELNKRISHDNWIVRRTGNGITINASKIGINLSLRFQYAIDTRKKYNLYSVEYDNAI